MKQYKEQGVILIMDEIKHIIDAQATLPDGGHVRGPVTSQDNRVFLFRNVFSGLDFSIQLQKGDLGWYQCGGSSLQQPQPMIDEIGVYIDNALGNSPIISKITIE